LAVLLRRLLKLVVGLGVVVIVYLGVTAAQIWWTSRQHDAPHSAAIIVLGAAEYDGAPSPVLEARLSHALALWRANAATRIVVTGGKEKGDRYTEAGVSARWLEARKVPARDLIEEDGGRDSYQSVAAAAHSLGHLGTEGVIMVSDPFNEYRIVAIATRLGMRAFASPTRTSPIRGTAVLPYYGQEVLAVGVGRIIGYQALSDLMHP
jgi:uncharacterized SAM-binding protein YcdF (DUF218 family)